MSPWKWICWQCLPSTECRKIFLTPRWIFYLAWAFPNEVKGQTQTKSLATWQFVTKAHRWSSSPYSSGVHWHRTCFAHLDLLSKSCVPAHVWQSMQVSRPKVTCKQKISWYMVVSIRAGKYAQLYSTTEHFLKLESVRWLAKSLVFN